jgi:hypothetical protein
MRNQIFHDYYIVKLWFKKFVMQSHGHGWLVGYHTSNFEHEVLIFQRKSILVQVANVRFVRGIKMLSNGYLRNLNPSYLNWFRIQNDN